AWAGCSWTPPSSSSGPLPRGPPRQAERHHGRVRLLEAPLSILAVLATLHHHARAAGVAAAHGHLDLAAVVAVAWAGAGAGGTAGWIVGLKGGRNLLTATGPLQHLRLALIARGDRFYERYGAIAVLFTPSWIAGIHDMSWSRFLPANALSALVWAASVGVGAYLVGPSIADIVNDAGLAGAALVAALVALTAVLVLRRRRRR